MTSELVMFDIFVFIPVSGCRESNSGYLISFITESGCRESNSGYKHPMLAYYHYTTPRLCNKFDRVRHYIVKRVASQT